MRGLHCLVFIACVAACACVARAFGPDLVIPDLPDILHFGPVGRVHAYSVGFTVCNAGDSNASWVSFNNQHPVEGWNMYRIADGRIEQIGLSWLKHGFFADSQPGCGQCDPNQSGNRMGPGCQDVYDAQLNAYQPSLGPRSEVNPSTGYFPFPPSSPGGPSGNDVYKLCRVVASDLTTPDATYIVEGQIVHPDETSSRTTSNNNSYRQVTIDPATFEATLVGDTTPRTPAIYAWREHANGTNMRDDTILYSPVDVYGDGRYIVASRVTELSPYEWHYEYAIQNLTSFRAAATFTVPSWRGSLPYNMSFHDVPYHSGEPYNSIPWILTRDSTGWGWKTFETFEQNQNANALRWGTMYSYSFDSCVPPGQSFASIGLFRPAPPLLPDHTPEPDSFLALVWAPLGGSPTCIADVDNGLYEGCPDGGVTVDDLLYYLLIFSEGDIGADLDDGNETGVPDGGVTIEDLLFFLEHFEQGC